jgi:putative ABC transport system permease protein
MALLSDFRHAVRVLRKAPLFSLTSILSLAVGIAASTAIFSLADAMLFRPRVGITEPERVVDIGRGMRGEGFDNFGYPLFAALRERSTLFERMSAISFEPHVMSLSDGATTELVYATLVSGTFFDVLGTRPAAGRFFLPEEDRSPGAEPVIVLSHAFWMHRFKGDSAAVGTAITLSGRAYAIVGVAEPGFTGTSIINADFWVPFAMEQHVRSSDASLLANPNAVWHTAIGRLKPGVSMAQAKDELNAIMTNFFKESGDERLDQWTIAVSPSARIPAPARGPVSGFIALLGALTLLVLLIACSNVAGMLLARAVERRREVATRLAVGASRLRVVGQLLVEGFTLALMAAAVSIPATFAAIRLLTAFQPELPVPLLLELRVDPRVIAFALLLAIVTTVGFALVPALQSTRFELAPMLHGATATPDRRRAWMRQSLVAAQVAMALLLLVAAGLFLRSLGEAATIDAGFNSANVDVVQVDMRLGGYRGDAGVRATANLLDRVRLIPGVTSVAASRMVPLQGGGLGLGRLRVPGYVGPEGNDEIAADADVISPDYFRALELPLVRGRAFTAADRQGAKGVIIINEILAERVWPGRDAVGQHILSQFGAPGSGEAERPLEVVGVAKTSKYRSIGEAPRNFVYVPLAQSFMEDLTFYVRRAPGSSQIPAVRQAIRAFDPNLPVVHAQTLREATAIGLLPQKIAAWIAGSVGSVGLLLAALGLYGLAAFSVAQRTREIALRMALGATRESVLALVLRQSARLALIGGVVGLALALGVGMVLQSLLIGIRPIDPVAFGTAVSTLVVVLLAASWVPARRASRLDPMRALRSE